MAVSFQSACAWLCLSSLFMSVSAINITDANSTDFVGTYSNSSAVLLTNDTSFAVCVYPASGLYSFLGRVLYYCTLVFALFSRAHLWLVAGALAAALTYAGSAAVHACLLVWRGPNPFIENDSWLLYGILNSACLIAVPLLNWSGTLRRLGAKAASMRDRKGHHTQSEVSTRTIVVYWAVLVLVGFICIWQQILTGELESGMEYPDMGKVICAPGTNASQIRSSDGTPHLRVIDSDFVQKNRCSNPCDTINIPSIFRRDSDLVLLPHSKALLYNGVAVGKKFEIAARFSIYEQNLFNLDYYTLPFVLIQGVIATLFGRRDPREIRDLIYITLFMEHPLSRKPFLFRTQDFLVRFLAAFNYCLAVAVIIVCPVFFIVTLASTELQYWNQFPDAEAPYAVGQWGPWAVTCQVLLAALIGRYHDRVIHFFGQTGRRYLSRGGRSKNPPAPTDHDEEHGRLSLTTSHTTAATNPFAGKPDNPANITSPHPHSPLLSPPHKHSPAAAEAPPSLWARLQSTLHICYKTCAHPLNQSDEGLFDEMRNFFHWCRDPQAVSRHVVRHPIRPREENARWKEGDGDEVDALAGVVNGSGGVEKRVVNENERGDQGGLLLGGGSMEKVGDWEAGR